MMNVRSLVAPLLALVLTGCSLFELPENPVHPTELSPVVYPAGSPWDPAATVDASGAEVDSQSDRYIQRMVTEYTRNSTGGTRFKVVLVVESGSVPIYYADEATPRASVPISTAGYGARGVSDVPIPPYALPDSATDGHIAIIDTEHNREFNFWQLRKERGRWVSSAAAVLDLAESGVHRDRFSVAASGFPLAAGLVWPDELLSETPGAIDHALVFAYAFTRKDAYVAPATRSDGWDDAADALPMGARIQLDPDLDLSTLDPALTQVEMRIAEALQSHGAFLYDTGSIGSVIELNGVNPRSFSTDPYVGVERYSQEGGYIDIGNIPVDRLQVLEIGEVQTWGAPYPPEIAFRELYYGVE